MASFCAVDRYSISALGFAVATDQSRFGDSSLPCRICVSLVCPLGSQMSIVNVYPWRYLGKRVARFICVCVGAYGMGVRGWDLRVAVLREPAVIFPANPGWRH